MTALRAWIVAAARRGARTLFAAGLAVALVALAPTSAVAQDAGTATLLASPGSWPTTGAISSSTALALDPSAIYLNPAGLATQDERTFLIHHGLLQFNTSWDLAAIAYPIPGLGTAGLGVARIGSSGIDAYDASNQPIGTIGYSETSLAASVARHVYGPLVAGVTFKVLSQSLGDVSAAAPSIDLGFAYRPAKLLGGQIGFAAENVVAGSLDLGGPTESLDRTYRLGLASPEWRFGHLTAARGIVDLERAGAEGTKSRFGVEVNRFGIGALRAGLDRGRPLLGFGVQWRRYGFDYAFAQGEIEATQQIALHLAWGEPVSQYESRRRAEYAKAAEDTVRAHRAAIVARDRDKAEEAEANGDYEAALLLWEILIRERPDDATFAARAGRARTEIADRAKQDLEVESAKRLASTVTAMTRAALVRGDVEEAAGVWRGFVRPGVTPPGFVADSVAAIEAEYRAARDRAVARSVARADSLHRVGRVLDAAESAAFALRLNPEDPAALKVWNSLQLIVVKSAETSASLTRKLEALTAIHAASEAFTEARYADAQTSIRRALALEPSNEEARAWRDRIERRLSTPKTEIDARVKQLYIKGMEAFSSGDYREALRNWEQILVLDPLNESARRNVLEARERMKAEASR
jgi:tetratricopeptide (TPR) repeat protein